MAGSQRVNAKNKGKVVNANSLSHLQRGSRTSRRKAQSTQKWRCRTAATRAKVADRFFRDFRGHYADKIVNPGLNQGERRTLVANFYEHVCYGTDMYGPKDESVKKDVSFIQVVFNYPASSAKPGGFIEKVIRTHLSGERLDVRNRKQTVKFSAAESKQIARMARAGVSHRLITLLMEKVVNKELSYSTVLREIKSTFGGKYIAKRKRNLTNKDVGSTWCKARTEIAKQFALEFSVGFSYGGQTFKWVPEQILWADERHKNCTLGGSAANHSCVFRTDTENSEEFVTEEEGGEYGDEPEENTVKYPAQVRGLFSVALKRDGDGVYSGHCLEPFEYTGLWVKAPKEFNEERLRWRLFEIERVKKLKSYTGEANRGLWKKFRPPDDASPEVKKNWNPYEARYGVNQWGVEIDKVTQRKRKAMNVTDLMDHLIKVGNEFFRATPFATTWVLYHDALTSWWAKDAQAHMKANGFEHRQMQARGNTCANFARYKGKLVGNSPEFMPLDNNLFADFERAYWANVAVTALTKNWNDARRFKTGTPEDVWKTLRLVWLHCIPSHRIVQDVFRCISCFKTVADANGIAIKFQGARNGKRAMQGERGKKRDREGVALEKELKLKVILHPQAQSVADEIGMETRNANAAAFLASLGGEMEAQAAALQLEDEEEEEDE